jgi:hypothetical protein
MDIYLIKKGGIGLLRPFNKWVALECWHLNAGFLA